MHAPRSCLKLIGLFALLTGCGTAQKSAAYMSDLDYQNRPALSQAIITANEPMSEEAVQKMLSSKVVLPKRMNLAVVRLTDAADGVDFQTVDEEVANRFYQPASWGPRVQAVTPVPSLLLPKPVTLASLRKAAVLLQANMLLVVKPASYGNWKYELFRKDKGKGVTSLEVLLLDTKTSVVPYTSLVTESVEIAKAGGDYSVQELVSRAKKTSEAQALLQVPGAVAKFLAALP